MSKGPSKKKPGPAEVWDALSADAELERIKGLTPAELDAEIRADGGDPEAIGRRGAARAEKALAEHELPWTERAKARRAAMDARIGAWPSFKDLPRSELLARVHAAQSDARFRAPVVAAFRKRDDADVTDEELRAMLEDVEALRRMHGTGDE